jgi:predicted DNA-binding ribbon-helix-helix protein
LIARQQRQIIAELGGMRDDMTVLTAIAMRQDGTLAALLTEVRAMHAQHNRLASRVRELENPT